jgi:hypothetical protein
MMADLHTFAPLPELKMTSEETINLSLVVAASSSFIIDDMASCLVVNKSEVNFITSDAPVVLLNRFYRQNTHKFPGASGIGLSKSGLEIYYPISPRHLVLFYDRNVHYIEGKDANGVVHAKKKDVYLINRLQMLSCLQNVYASSKLEEAHIRDLFMKEGGCRESRLVETVALVEGKERGTFVHPQPGAENPNYRLLSSGAIELDQTNTAGFVRRRYKPRYYFDGSAAGAIRDKAWGDIVDHAQTMISRGKLKLSQFPKFARRHPYYPQVGNSIRKVHGEPLT